MKPARVASSRWVVLLPALLGCWDGVPDRDDHQCWSNDHQIWDVYWETWCEAMERCETLDELGEFRDIHDCHAEAASERNSFAATCLNGCAMDECLVNIATYTEDCHLAYSAIPLGYCNVVFYSSNPNYPCGE